MLRFFGGRVRDSDAQEGERVGYCPYCRKQTKHFRSVLTGIWYCLTCGQEVR